MNHFPPAIHQTNGDLLIPAQTAEVLRELLQRIQREVGRLQGQSCARPGQMETGPETAQRQDSVDKLSASAGVAPPRVTARRLADEHFLVDTSALAGDLQTIIRLLFTADGPS